MKYWILNILIWTNLLAFSQADTLKIEPNGMVIFFHNDSNSIPSLGAQIYGELTGFIHTGLVKGNPELMNDRIILDSNYTIISSMVNNQYGFSYYDFYTNGNKKHEQIQIYNPKIDLRIWYSEQGYMRGQIIESNFSVATLYYDTISQPIEIIQIELEDYQTDSILEKYNIDYSATFEWKPISCLEIKFYKNGKIESIGTKITLFNEINKYRYNLGSWKYYNNNNGNIREKEYFELYIE